MLKRTGKTLDISQFFVFAFGVIAGASISLAAPRSPESLALPANFESLDVREALKDIEFPVACRELAPEFQKLLSWKKQNSMLSQAGQIPLSSGSAAHRKVIENAIAPISKFITGSERYYLADIIAQDGNLASMDSERGVLQLHPLLIDGLTESPVMLYWLVAHELSHDLILNYSQKISAKRLSPAGFEDTALFEPIKSSHAQHVFKEIIHSHLKHLEVDFLAFWIMKQMGFRPGDVLEEANKFVSMPLEGLEISPKISNMKGDDFLMYSESILRVQSLKDFKKCLEQPTRHSNSN